MRITRGGLLKSSDAAGAYPLSPVASMHRPPVPAVTFVAGANAGVSGHSLTLNGTPAASNLNDTTAPILGDRSITFTTTTTAGNIGVYRSSISPTVDMTGKGLVAWFQFDSYTALSSVDIVVINTAGSSSFTKSGIVVQAGGLDSQQYVRPGEPVKMYIPWSVIASGTQVGTMLRTDVAYIRMRFYNASGQALTVKHGGFATYPEPATMFPNGVISLTYDDTYVTQYTAARLHLDKYGYRGSLFPILEYVGSRLSLAQIRKLHDENGWEIGTHATTDAIHTAGLDSLAPDALAAEMLTLRQWQITNGFADSPSHAYPRGRYSAAVEAAAAKHWSSGRTVWGQMPDVVGTPYPYRLRSYNVLQADSLATLTAKVDVAKASRTHLVFTIHDVIASGNADANAVLSATHASLIDYINSAGVPVMPIGEVMAVGSVL